MDAIAYYYGIINRNAIVIKPRQPLFDWINGIYPDNIIESVDEGTVYLLREKDNNEQIKSWLKKNFDFIFQNELNNWHTDEKDWPKNRTYQQFIQWFAFEIHSMILDLEESQLKKD